MALWRFDSKTLATSKNKAPNIKDSGCVYMLFFGASELVVSKLIKNFAINISSHIQYYDWAVTY